MTEVKAWNREAVNESIDSIKISVSVSDADFVAMREHLEKNACLLFENIGDRVLALKETANRIKSALQTGFRFCIVDGLRFEELDDNPKLRDAYICAICSLIGHPTITDQTSCSIVWPIKVNADSGVKNLTYSQHNGSAALHTDTQYFEHPEEVMSLWCLQSDRNGDGESLVADGQMVIRKLLERAIGKETVRILSKSRFPFRVPSIFTADATDECVEIFVGPIIGKNPLIRYRRETIDKAREIDGYELSEKLLKMLDEVDSVLRDPEIAFRFLLKRGEVIFTNNHEILHGRTAFHDPERHLLRVRFNFSLPND